MQSPEPINRAQWIWSTGDPGPKNFYLYCRKVFTLQEKPISAPVYMTADSRYKVYVNGAFVGRGPVRADQRWQYYDAYNLAPFLHAGENVVAAIVHQYGVPTGSYTLGRGGLLVQGEVRYQDGRVVKLDTDSSWRVLPSSAWDRDTPRVSPAIMWMEIYDARKEPVGWQRPGYDDSAWERPVMLGRPPVFPWENLVARDIPFLTEEERFPAAILDEGIVEPAPPSVRLDLAKTFGATDGQVAYLFAYLHSPAEQRVALSLQSWSGMPRPRQIWVNGIPQSPAPLDSNSGARALIEFAVKIGWNELLVKVGLDRSPSKTELMLGPASGRSYHPIKWYADKAGPPSRAWIGGPYGRPGEAAFDVVYEMERLVLSRAPGTPVHLPGKVVKLTFTPSKNVALVMAMETRRSQRASGLRDADKLLRRDDGPAMISTAASGGDVYMTLDFGKEVSGYVRLRLNGVAGGIVDLGYSEQLLDGRVDTLRGEFPWNFGDRYIMRDGPQEWELFFWKGFRYLQLTFRQLPRPVEVESVSLLFTSYPVQYRGAFESSDPLLNKIWDVGRWTLQLCMHDAYEDTPWREQSQWVGDAQVEVLANYMTFGDVALATKYLRQIAQGQNEDGALPATYPASVTVYPRRQPPLPPYGIPTFMAQWVSTLLAHYRYTGELKLVSELFRNVVRTMAYFDRYLGPHGLLAGVPGFVFLDWIPDRTLMGLPIRTERELTGLNSHYYRALLDAADLASLVGDHPRWDAWRRKAQTVKQSINDRLWSEAKGTYLHGRIGDRPIDKLAVHDGLLAAYAGVAPMERMTRSLDTLFKTHSSDIVQIGTPYFYFFYLQALRRAERHHEALVVTRQAYGKMLAAGATTWWEHLGGYASLSHGWGTAPNFDLPAYVLGVLPTEPGFTAFRVEPEPADLDWAKGVIPSVRGDIAVEWKRNGGKFELLVTVPMRARVELSVPALSLEATQISGQRLPERADFQDGRARYWVTGPGLFKVNSMLSPAKSEQKTSGQ